MKRDDVAKKLNAYSAYDDDNTSLVKVLLTEGSFNAGGLSTLADRDGNRITDLQFDYLSDSSCGLFRVHIPGGKYGYMNENGVLAIKPIYDSAGDFSEDLAWVRRNGRVLILGKDGSEIVPEHLENGEYVRVESFRGGRARFSTVDMGGFWGFLKLAYHHDEAENAGVWGYVDTTGHIIVKPKYIFAEDFNGELAVVCDGEWSAGERWNNKYRQGCYWSERMLWGAIDRSGNIAIPCKFDEIKWRSWSPDYGYTDITKRCLAARDTNGRWGLIDFKGNWVVGPKFGDIGYECDVSPNGDMFIFYRREIWGGGDPDLVPCGIYSVSRQKVVLPADKYVEIDFDGDDTVTVRETPNGEEKKLTLSVLPDADEGILYEEWQEGMP